MKRGANQIVTGPSSSFISPTHVLQRKHKPRVLHVTFTQTLSLKQSILSTFCIAHNFRFRPIRSCLAEIRSALYTRIVDVIWPTRLLVTVRAPAFVRSMHHVGRTVCSHIGEIWTAALHHFRWSNMVSHQRQPMACRGPSRVQP